MVTDGKILTYAGMMLGVVITLKLLWNVFSGIFTTKYMRVEALFSRGELAFLRVLKRAVGERFAVYGKVRVADVIRVNDALGRTAWKRAFYPISSKHFDFILCTHANAEIVAAIELDDRSHNQKDRRERDELLRRVCASAGVPLVRIEAASKYHIKDIQRIVFGELKSKENI